MGFNIGKFLGNAAKTAGKGFHTLTHAASSVTGDIGRAASKVPVIGPGLHGAFDVIAAAPFTVADKLSSGENISKVALDTLKQQVSDVQQIAPYAQAVISEVPGVGSGVSGAISASLALAQGHPITEAVEEGLKGAMPGGPAGQALFSIASDVMAGKPVTDVAVNALPIPAAAKQALHVGLTAAKSVADGKPLTDTAIKAGLSSLPPDLQKMVATSGTSPEALINGALKVASGSDAKLGKALQIGMAVGNAKKLQAVKASQLTMLQTITNYAIAGNLVAQADPAIMANRSLYTDQMAFNAGLGVLSHSGVSPADLATMRNAFHTTDSLKAFDAGLATHIGKVTKNPPSVALKNPTPAKVGAYYLTHGLHSSSPEHVKAVIQPVVSHPEAKAGVGSAATEIANARLSIWHRVKVFLHLEKDPTKP